MKKSTLSILTIFFVVFVVSLYGSFFVLGWDGDTPPLFAGFMSMVFLFGFILHRSMSEQESRRHHHHRYPFPKPSGAHFEKKSNLDGNPKEVDERLKAMEKPDDASPDIPEGT